MRIQNQIFIINSWTIDWLDKVFHKIAIGLLPDLIRMEYKVSIYNYKRC